MSICSLYRGVMTDLLPTPTRFGSDPAWARRAARPLRLVAGRRPEPTPAELDRMRAALLRRDDEAHALVRAVREEHSVTMPQFRQALEHGIGSVPGAPPALRRFFAVVDARPAWVDDALLDRGARAMQKLGWDGFDLLTWGSLLGGYRSAAALEPLVRSGRLLGASTARRTAETSRWFLACIEDDGMRRGSEGWRLTVHVRVMHAFVNYQLEQDPTWDWELRGTPINQYDQASTLAVFSTTPLLQARLLGIRVSRRDSRAVMHLWSYIGWLLGVEDHWLPHTEQAGRRIIYHLLAHDPGPDESSRVLARALVDSQADVPGGGWRGVLAREAGLSSATFLNGRTGMHELGLPARLPWYPALRIPVNLLWTHLVGRLPGGEALVVRRGRRGRDRRVRLQHGRLAEVPQPG
ncbi:conserved hypothetical protein [Nocardioides sp. JS614]|nr:conserved hypothetical protein [Nocardioides sp. JS614]